MPTIKELLSKRLWLQSQIEKNTYKESRTSFSFLNAAPDKRKFSKERVGLCQIRFDFRPLLDPPREHPEAHLYKLGVALTQARDAGIDTLFFPELAFPPVGSRAFELLQKQFRQSGITVVGGSIMPAVKKIDTVRQILIDRSRILNRRLSYVAGKEARSGEVEIESGNGRPTTSERIRKLLAADLKQRDFLSGDLIERSADYFYSVKSCFTNGRVSHFKKSVCTQDEFEGGITPGAEYGAIHSKVDSYLLASGAEFLGNVPSGYEGEARLIDKVLNYLAGDGTNLKDFYRLELNELYSQRKVNGAPGLLAVISYEPLDARFYVRPVEYLLKQVPSLSLVFYTNHSGEGQTSIFVRPSINRVANITKGEIKVEELENARRFYLPRDSEALLIADLERNGNGLNLVGVKAIPLT